MANHLRGSTHLLVSTASLRLVISESNIETWIVGGFCTMCCSQDPLLVNQHTTAEWHGALFQTSLPLPVARLSLLSIDNLDVVCSIGCLGLAEAIHRSKGNCLRTTVSHRHCADVARFCRK